MKLAPVDGLISTNMVSNMPGGSCMIICEENKSFRNQLHFSKLSSYSTNIFWIIWYDEYVFWPLTTTTTTASTMSKLSSLKDNLNFPSLHRFSLPHSKPKHFQIIINAIIFPNFKFKMTNKRGMTDFSWIWFYFSSKVCRPRASLAAILHVSQHCVQRVLSVSITQGLWKVGQNEAKDLKVENVHLCLLKHGRLGDWQNYTRCLTWGKEHLYFETFHKDISASITLIALREQQATEMWEITGVKKQIFLIHSPPQYGFYEYILTILSAEADNKEKVICHKCQRKPWISFCKCNMCRAAGVSACVSCYLTDVSV